MVITLRISSKIVDAIYRRFIPNDYSTFSIYFREQSFFLSYIVSQDTKIGKMTAFPPSSLFDSQCNASGERYIGVYVPTDHRLKYSII